MDQTHARKLARPCNSRGASVAIVTSEGRIIAMRLLLSATLLLALALHWMR